MEGLVADSNRSIATLAITTLLKIGEKERESSVFGRNDNDQRKL
jgi:hypothetical protein